MRPGCALGFPLARSSQCPSRRFKANRGRVPQAKNYPKRLDLLTEILDRFHQTLGQSHLRFPVEVFPRLCNIWTTLLRVVLGKRSEADSALRAGRADDFFC